MGIHASNRSIFRDRGQARATFSHEPGGEDRLAKIAFTQARDPPNRVAPEPAPASVIAKLCKEKRLESNNLWTRWGRDGTEFMRLS